MKERVFLFICIIFLSLSFISFRWPLSTVKLTSTFGESRGDHLHDGVDIVSYDKRVFPVDDSIVLYAWNRSYFPFDNYSGSGNYMVLDHGQYASIYLHLDNSPHLSANYTMDQPIGHFSNTGRSYGAHIHFNVYNRDTWDSYNFLTLVDELEDEEPPVIDSMAFYIDNSYIRISDNSSIRLTKHYPLLLQVYDRIKKGDHFGIYKGEIYVNGKKMREFEIKGAVLGKNSLTISGIPFTSMYHGKYLQVPGITYKEGQNTFRVVAYDLNGNRSEKTFTLNIKLDM